MTVEKSVVQKLVFLRDRLDDYNSIHDDNFEHQCNYAGQKLTVGVSDIENWISAITTYGESPTESTLVLSNQLYAAFVQMRRRVKNG